jgi:hypothetical protein
MIITDENEYGEATVGHGGIDERKVPIESWISAHYEDGRKISVIKFKEEKGYAFTVENHESSERSTKQQMWLSEKSMFALIATLNIHFLQDKVDPSKKLAEMVTNESVDYACSDNLTNKTP